MRACVRVCVCVCTGYGPDPLYSPYGSASSLRPQAAPLTGDPRSAGPPSRPLSLRSAAGLAPSLLSTAFAPGPAPALGWGPAADADPFAHAPGGLYAGPAGDPAAPRFIAAAGAEGYVVI